MTIDSVADGYALAGLAGSEWEKVVLEEDCVCRLCRGNIPAGKPLLIFRGNAGVIYGHEEDCGLVTLDG